MDPVDTGQIILVQQVLGEDRQRVVLPLPPGTGIDDGVAVDEPRRQVGCIAVAVNKPSLMADIPRNPQMNKWFGS